MLDAPTPTSSSEAAVGETRVGQCTVHVDHAHLLGSGGYGSVFAGTMPVAAKRVPLRPGSQAQHRERLAHELGLKHHAIVRVFDVQYVGTDLWVVMERCHCNWEEYLRDGATDTQKISGIRQVATGIEFLHESRICHRDIKPENILIFDKPGMCVTKLADFGLLRKLGEDSTMGSNCGTLLWKAPELFTDYGPVHYKKNIDVFSFGLVIVYSFTTPLKRLHWPHYGRRLSRDAAYDVLGDVDVAWAGRRELMALLNGMLAVDPEQRPAARQLVVKLTYDINDDGTDVYEAIDEDNEDDGHYENQEALAFEDTEGSPTLVLEDPSISLAQGSSHPVSDGDQRHLKKRIPLSVREDETADYSEHHYTYIGQPESRWTVENRSEDENDTTSGEGDGPLFDGIDIEEHKPYFENTCLIM